jgi:hypothetical protein
MEIARDMAMKLFSDGGIYITDRWGAQYMLLQGQLFTVVSEDTDDITSSKSISN